MGQGGVGIGVPVQCCTECNSGVSSVMQLAPHRWNYTTALYWTVVNKYMEI